MTYKEQLSQHVENIFKRYSSPGLHICDLSTGGGKSYTIGKLTCEYYPEKFERIVILCIQNKLVDGMKREINSFIGSNDSLISSSDLLVVENNSDVIKKAIKNGYFKELLEDMNHQIDELKDNMVVSKLRYSYNKIKKRYDTLENLIKTLEDNNKNDFQEQIEDDESKLRRDVRSFFESFKKHFEKARKVKLVNLKTVLTLFPSLSNVYPQVECKQKKVLLMTVQKAMYGIDPILSDIIHLKNISDDKKRTLILFDESDQGTVAMRNTIIDLSIDKTGGDKRFAKGYNGYLQYKELIDKPEHISNEYYGTLLEDCIKRAQSITTKNWKRTFGEIEPYKSIFLEETEELENYRRGVFFSGPALRLNISPKGHNTSSFICYRKKEKQFLLIHAENKDIETLKKRFEIAIPLDSFLALIINNTTSIKSQLSKVILESFHKSQENFRHDSHEIATNSATSNHFIGYPTLDREIHTLFSRFETPSEYQFEQQIQDFITNRKNLIVGNDNKTKLPDYSVYSQGVQLYQEEVDERDNQHRIRLSCREISTTPEKILIDLVNTSGTSVVLCSATSSCRSVISNCDITYLKQTLGEKVHFLSKEDRDTFDNLVAKTYPKNHRIEIVPIEKYEFTDKRENAIILPGKYRQKFSEDAINDGLVDKWFKLTYRVLKQSEKDINNILFQMYRLFQFIDAYHWFINHDDINSMIYFQNRTGDKDKIQIQTLSCLIDGSYKDMDTEMEDELPTDWENKHIRISKEWEDVETNILSKLCQNKDAKIMLVSAYGSFKAGANLQYKIPEGLDYVAGDNWDDDQKKMQKDWDAIYVQSPTAYLMMNEDGHETSYEISLHRVMLSLMMLYERSCLSNSDVVRWLAIALSNPNSFMFGNDPGIQKDKAAWAQTTVEQAIGRICRTRNKPHTTYILFDESMKPYFDSANLEKSLTKEFRTLADYIMSHKETEVQGCSTEEVNRCNDANRAESILKIIRNSALRYTPHPYEDEYDDEPDGTEIPHKVRSSQIMIQSFKRTIIRKPVIDSLDELDENDKHLTFIHKCYGSWERDDKGCFAFSCEPNHQFRICIPGKGKALTIAPSDVRLDILMKNEVLKAHFEKNGFATSWKSTGLILHPQILWSDYAGEIGEEAFKAIVLHYTECKEEHIKHLEGKDYELADFVITKPDGGYKIAFDVKNMNPKADHNDKPGDMPTGEKRRRKKERLCCELITVNMIKIEKSGIDDIHEILGVIDDNGAVIPSAIEQLRLLIND